MRPRPVDLAISLSHGARSLSFEKEALLSHAGLISSVRFLGSSVRVLSIAVFSHQERTSGTSGAFSGVFALTSSLRRSGGVSGRLAGSGGAGAGFGVCTRSCGRCGAGTMRCCPAIGSTKDARKGVGVGSAARSGSGLGFCRGSHPVSSRFWAAR